MIIAGKVPAEMHGNVQGKVHETCVAGFSRPGTATFPQENRPRQVLVPENAPCVRIVRVVEFAACLLPLWPAHSSVAIRRPRRWSGLSRKWRKGVVVQS